jgi:multimeric flavodoxin WrbA
MKIVALLASPHGNKGNTAALLRIALEGAESEGARASTIFLKGNSVLPCKACDVCHKKGICNQKDDFESIKNKILSADGLVLASPNYIFNVSAQMKAFMDRCCGIIHCMQFWGKYGVSVVTSGGGDEKPIADYMNHFLTITGAVPVGSVWASMSAMPEGSFTGRVKDDAFELGRKLVAAWRSGEVPSAVDSMRENFRERMLRLVQYRKQEWPFEYGYWEEKLKS